MCGIACYFGNDAIAGEKYLQYADKAIAHRGPDGSGASALPGVALLHRRLSIVELSPLGNQPMESSWLRTRFLPRHEFRGTSDTETIIELFSQRQEEMFQYMVGMWAIVIWDKVAKKILISRDRFGQKPVYTRRTPQGEWLICSEIKPLLNGLDNIKLNATAIAEYLALGNYEHLDNQQTFYKDIHHFPQGCYAWVAQGDRTIHYTQYWQLPYVAPKDKIPCTKEVMSHLHNLIVEGVLSQTMADVPIGLTLSGGIDSSIVAGILAAYYDKEIHIFTAQSHNSLYDESKYVDAVVKRFNSKNLFVHRKNLQELSIKNDLERYIGYQEEPFGDPSILAHGFLMSMAAEAGIKVVLNGQGADEMFFGYNNMNHAILIQQLRSFQIKGSISSLVQMKLGKRYFLRMLLLSLMPGLEKAIRTGSRQKRRSHLTSALLHNVDDSTIKLARYDNFYSVWAESVYGVHLPHLVHYDDRNGMAYSLEGRMPFLDHRIAEYIAGVRPEDFLKQGLRKYILRETCKQYLPDIVYKRTDKIAFYTPLIDTLIREKQWVIDQYKHANFITDSHKSKNIGLLQQDNIDINDALHIFRQLSVLLWQKRFNVSL
ncbi:MAG: asparagine synthase (glutamine-hydrolyzing) [Chitinophagia bacterium]|nr:asparagine synthase (glutamine-hydrolyzing) [Chitinophagia bacterium]